MNHVSAKDVPLKHEYSPSRMLRAVARRATTLHTYNYAPFANAPRPRHDAREGEPSGH
jgi:hypothetical protein